MIRRNISFIGLITTLLFAAGSFAAFVAVPAAHAQTAPTPSPVATPMDAASCTITKDDLAAVNAAAADGLTAELAARRALLTRVITCAEANVQSLEDDLAKVQAPNGTATFQSQLASKLGEAMSYYDLELGKVKDAGIAGTQGIANEVLAWRAGTYNPLADQVANYILWAENQGIFATAESRLAQITNIVSFVEQAAPNTTLAQDLTAAQSFITSATQQNTAAENALIQSAPSKDALALITSSLQSLSDAYQKFSDISGIIQKLLPISGGASGSGK